MKTRRHNPKREKWFWGGEDEYDFHKKQRKKGGKRPMRDILEEEYLFNDDEIEVFEADDDE